MKSPVSIYQLKVTLRGTRPTIWRRVRVRSDITLLRLHDVLQIVMGWTDSHLHQFIANDKYYGTSDPEFPEPRQNEKKVRLNEVLKKPNDRLVYEYDFGDGWTHDVTFEKVLEPEPGEKYPHVLAGKGACPPEDCGGVHGYYHLLEVLKNPEHPEHRDMVEWLGRKFDPEAFDVHERNLVFHGGWYLPKEHV